MDKPKLNYLVDIGLFISFLIVGITGLLKFPGFLHLFGLRLRDLPVIQLSNLHDWSGLLMVALVALHLFLHRQWIVAMTFSSFKKKK